MKYTVVSIISVLLLTVLTACPTLTVRETFTVDVRSPQISVGSIEAQFDKFFSKEGMQKKEITVLYFYNDDIVGLQYTHNMISFHQFWSRDNRDAFARNLAAYKNDFEQRNFGRSSKKTKKHYGTVVGYIVWRASAITIQANGHPDIGMGYFFMNNSPYFTIHQPVTYFNPQSRTNGRKSEDITMYFTRAQADELAAFFDQDYLDAAIPPELRSFRGSAGVVEIDDYGF